VEEKDTEDLVDIECFLVLVGTRARKLPPASLDRNSIRANDSSYYASIWCV